MTMAKNESVLVAEQSHSSSSGKKNRTKKGLPSSPSSEKIKSDGKSGNKNNNGNIPNMKPTSFASTSTKSTSLQSEEQHEAAPPVSVIRKSGTEVIGVIAPSLRQKQLMRQVSGLGLEDPVFGKNNGKDQSMKTEHASFIFDDMDIHDVPEDMRDMFSLASDRTDVVETNEGQLLESTKISNAYSLSSMGRRSATSSSIMPPLGLDPGMSVTISPSTKNKTLTVAASLPKGKIPQNPTLNNSTQHSLSRSVISDPNYVPPAGYFKTKKRSNKDRRNSNASSVVLADKALAAQVNAMLSMDESATIFSSTVTGITHNSHRRAANRPVPKRRESSLSTSSSRYVPPPLPISVGTPIQEDERNLPESMDAIFSSKKSTRIKKSPTMDSQDSTKKKSKRKSIKTKAEGNNNS